VKVLISSNIPIMQLIVESEAPLTAVVYMNNGIQEIGKLCPPSLCLMKKVGCVGSKGFLIGKHGNKRL